MANRPSAKAKAALLAVMAVSALMVLTKLFTTVAWLADEPTVMLAVRARPSLDSALKISDERELHGMAVLITDENRFVGQRAYEVVTGAGWLVGCLLIAGGIGYRLSVRRSAIKG